MTVCDECRGNFKFSGWTIFRIVFCFQKAHLRRLDKLSRYPGAQMAERPWPPTGEAAGYGGQACQVFTLCKAGLALL
jgi:hypothetical protein